MGDIVSIAANVLAPGLGSVIGPIVQGLAGPLEGMLGQGAQGIGGELGNLVSQFEKAFLGPLQQLGQGLFPPQGQFPQCPYPFPAPPYANDPLGPFRGNGSDSGSAVSPDAVNNIGGAVDDLQNQAMQLLQKPNASQQDIANAQRLMNQANQLFTMLTEMLKSDNQNKTSALRNIS